MTLTIKNQSPKRVYAAQPTAQGILTKLTKANPERKFDIVKVAAGWQVVEITKLPAYMPPAKPLPVQKSVPVTQKVTAPGAAKMQFVFKGESPKYLNLGAGEGVKYVGKSTILGYEVDPQGLTVVIEMSATLANKLAPIALNNVTEAGHENADAA